MRKVLDETDEDGKSERERIFRHQVEVAQSWEVRIVGRDGNGELLKVASGRDSTAAAEFVFGLVGLKPEDVVKNSLALAEHFRQVERDRLEVTLKLLGERVNQWAPERTRDFLASCARDPRGFLLAAEEYIQKSEGPADADCNAALPLDAAAPPAQLSQPASPPEVSHSLDGDAGGTEDE